MENENPTQFNLTNFLFGNIDSQGQLEDDIFDNETKKYVNTLEEFHIFGDLNNKILEENLNPPPGDDSISIKSEEKFVSYDYSNISDVSSEDEPFSEQGGFDDKVKNVDLNHLKMPLKAQLAPLIPKEFANMDVRQIFPDFEYNQILRFNKLFGPGKPSSLPKIWRNFSKRAKRLTQTYEEHLAQTSKDLPGTSQSFEASSNQVAASDDEEKMLEFIAPEEKNICTTEEVPDNDDDIMQQDIYLSTMKRPESNYGFELDKKEICTRFNLVTQLEWENDIIWDGAALLAGNSPSTKENSSLQFIKNKLNITKEREGFVGWLPTATIRNFQAAVLNQQSEEGNHQNYIYTQAKFGGKTGFESKFTSEQRSEMVSIPLLTEQNPHLIHYQWENDIIWDGDLIKDQVDVAKWNEMYLSNKSSNSLPVHRPPVYSREDFDEIEQALNISNDQFYTNTKVNGGCSIDSAILLSQVGALQHSTPASELWSLIFPTHMGPLRLKTFHRPLLKKYSHGSTAHPGWHPVIAIENEIEKIAQIREKERLASGGGDMFFMHKPQDLSATDGDLILAEYSEEYPPLVMNIGMATHIKNYHKRRPGKETNALEFEHGTTAYTHTSPFLGSLAPGQRIQALENNMFRAPIYLHKFPQTSFLIVRTRHNYKIRRLKDIFTVGQECPLMEVPCPNSKKTNIFLRDFLQVYLYRLFRASTDKPPKVYMEDVKRAFPNIAESSLRKKLKTLADFEKKIMPESEEKSLHKSKSGLSSMELMRHEQHKRLQKRFRVWTLKHDFRLPSEEEIREMVWPEHCCAWYSSLAAEYRLTEAGYALSLLGEGNAPSSGPVAGGSSNAAENSAILDDDEIKAAPWNTTRSFLAAVRGKCLLDLNGTADPTGCGEGFSYIKMSNKPQQFKDEISGLSNSLLSKKSVTGTDADLRKLSLKNAKQLLRNFDVPEDELRKLSRWEIIDVVRTLSTQQALLGDDTVTKFARGNKFSATEHQEKFKEECQRIFDLQNRVLASSEILSTDEDSSGEDSDFEEMGKNIENMLANHKSKKGFVQKKIDPKSSIKDLHSKKAESRHQKISDRKLKITRTFRNHEGKEFVRIETVRNPGVVEAYLRIRESQDPELLAYFSRPDETRKQEMMKEKRRLVDQLKRLRAKEERQRLAQPIPSLTPKKSNKKNEITTKLGDAIQHNREPKTLEEKLTSTTTKRDQDNPESVSKALGGDGNLPETDNAPSENSKESSTFNPKVKCGSCGEVGHMKTNRLCPLYEKSGKAPITVAMTQEEEEIAEKTTFDENIQDLVNVEGTKIILSKTIIDHYDNIRKKSLILKFPKPSTSQPEATQRPGGVDGKKLKLKNLITPMKKSGDKSQFLPSSSKKGYFSALKARHKTSQAQVAGRLKFGLKNKLNTNNYKFGKSRRKIHSWNKRGSDGGANQLDYLKKPHQSNKRRTIDPIVTLSSLLENILNEMRDLPDTQPFILPVNIKNVPDYYQVIEKPMDLQTIRENLHQRKYHSREEFLADALQIVENSRIYNGLNSYLTSVAEAMIELCVTRLGEKEDRIMKLEKSINPLLDEDDQVALSFIFLNIINEKLMTIPESWPFHNPVNPKLLKDYYSKITEPMDLGSVVKKAKEHKYKNQDEFLSDIKLMMENSLSYNGPESSYTKIAELIYDTCVEDLKAHEEQINELQLGMELSKQKSLSNITQSIDFDKDDHEDEDKNYTGVEMEIDLEEEVDPMRDLVEKNMYDKLENDLEITPDNSSNDNDSDNYMKDLSDAD